MKKTIDQRYLVGISFRSARPEKSEGGVRHKPYERALRPEDVLDFTDHGDRVVIVTADGRKHAVDKAEAEAKTKAEAEAKTNAATKKK